EAVGQGGDSREARRPGDRRRRDHAARRSDVRRFGSHSIGAAPRRAAVGVNEDMEIKAEEISQIIRKQIEEYDQKVSVVETGTVLTVGDGIARVYGLAGAMAGELLEFPHEVRGIVLNLEEDNVGVALLGEYEKIRENDQVKRTGKIASVPVGDALVGRVVNALGQPIDGKGPIVSKDVR